MGLPLRPFTLASRLARRAFSMATGRRSRVFVVGVGMTKFEKPGSREDFDYPAIAKEAGLKALQDAALSYKDIEQAVVGYCFGDSTSGQRALYELGMTGIPIYNVNNNCSTGSTALIIGKQLIEGGMANCAMALGFEKMARDSMTKQQFADRASPMEKFVEVLSETHGIAASPIAAQLFGSAGIEHMRRYGTTKEHFAKIAQKNHRHSVNNPNSQFRDDYTIDQIMNSKMVYDPLTLLQCCPRSDGGAAAILCNEEFVHKHGLEPQAVEILAMEMATDQSSTFQEKNCIKLVGYDMTKDAARRAFESAGLRPHDVSVVELHDCFATNELISYEALGLCDEGEGSKLVDHGDNTYGGKFVVNPSGGLISKGHPLGATGLAQCTELCWQLRGVCGPRQVANAQIALQHNIGLGGAVVVGLYKLGFPQYSAHNRYHRLSPTMMNAPSNGFKASAIFREFEQRFKKEGQEIVKKLKGIYVFKVKDDSSGQVGTWIVDAKNGSGSVTYGDGKGDCTITMKDCDFVDLMTGKLDGQKAFFQGKMKITGNLTMAMKLRELQQKPSKSKL
ncbi:sterol carrier protein 2-like [Corticium candelabrum]|uniref:sterol carrier protein 2-like n=1 Tax=Corticium candelabrum TaxID=121492 RepID=UPI002E2748B1|nr:sterol carrier protein 2-like [Corticium candelabrum]